MERAPKGVLKKLFLDLFSAKRESNWMQYKSLQASQNLYLCFSLVQKTLWYWFVVKCVVKLIFFWIGTKIGVVVDNDNYYSGLEQKMVW